MIKDNTKRFSDRVENYVKYRPGYPEEIVPFLEKATDLNAASKIADIGSGTGKSTQLFLDSGYAVTGVEPNHEMRGAAEVLFEDLPHFKSIEGTAEETTLEENSYSHIIAGQAFHWFNPPLAKKEFQLAGKILDSLPDEDSKSLREKISLDMLWLKSNEVRLVKSYTFEKLPAPSNTLIKEIVTGRSPTFIYCILSSTYPRL